MHLPSVLITILIILAIGMSIALLKYFTRLARQTERDDLEETELSKRHSSPSYGLRVVK